MRSAVSMPVYMYQYKKEWKTTAGLNIMCVDNKGGRGKGRDELKRN